jgi:hypothetical protein
VLTTRVLTSGLLTFLAYAQSPVSAGSFVLPIETRWGLAVLPAGPYTYRLPSANGLPILMVDGQGKSIRIMVSAPGTSSHAFSNHSSLTLIRSGQNAWVQSFDIGIKKGLLCQLVSDSELCE